MLIYKIISFLFSPINYVRIIIVCGLFRMYGGIQKIHTIITINKTTTNSIKEESVIVLVYLIILINILILWFFNLIFSRYFNC